MKRDEALQLVDSVLKAWNGQNIDEVISCYTPTCVYLDPNTGGTLHGHDSLRDYLSRLFAQWQMHWSIREFFLFDQDDGGAFLWHAELTSVSDGRRFEVEGMDLVLVRGDKLSRNEVYFDRVALL